ncbi:MAG TPA: hypothetical protein VFF90_05810 [Saprospiraceae bacterium]|nr:hypothetical protein [Saprospiraceae bacterium]
MNIRLINYINKSLPLLVFCFIFFLAACSKDPDPVIDCTGLTPTYNADIKPILDASCALSGCHDAITHQNGYDFSSYGPASEASKNGRFLGAIQHKSGYTAMPYNMAKLSNDHVQQLTCWVETGSPE